jgi:Ubiquitin-conjugating enzyme
MYLILGPYTPAILRFQISFPPAYPNLPPLVTFSTDMFHPLITPLTTYMYTTDIQDNGTVSATDDERLPPGGFSLRHGFPDWFGRASKSVASSRQTSGQYLQTPGGVDSGQATPDTGAPTSPTAVQIQRTRPQSVSTYEILRYIRSAFIKAEVLDAVPLEAAGNPGAWHAWRSFRVKSGKLLPPSSDVADLSDGQSDGDTSPAAPEGYKRLPGGIPPAMAASRKPGEWNWEGVWEVRAKRDIDKSVAESTLYGNAASSDDMVSRYCYCHG